MKGMEARQGRDSVRSTAARREGIAQRFGFREIPRPLTENVRLRGERWSWRNSREGTVRLTDLILRNRFLRTVRLAVGSTGTQRRLGVV